MTVCYLVKVKQGLVDGLLQLERYLHGIKACPPLIAVRLLQRSRLPVVTYLMNQNKSFYKHLFALYRVTASQVSCRSGDCAQVAHTYCTHTEHYVPWCPVTQYARPSCSGISSTSPHARVLRPTSSWRTWRIPAKPRRPGRSKEPTKRKVKCTSWSFDVHVF